MTLLLGVIADDFTGATDVANSLVQQGMRVVQVLGVPADDFNSADAQAIVVALKSRTNSPAQAIEWSLQALHWLRRRGAGQILFKYCSTFDSTPRGNIGPVADALLDALDARFALVCPAFPDNQRRVYQGHLFVGEQLLSESSMKDHPLTPMQDSSLLRLLQAQTSKAVGLVAHDRVAVGRDSILQAIDERIAEGISYVVIDAISNTDLAAIGAAAAGHRLVTGGSAIATGLALNFRQQGHLDGSEASKQPNPGGRSLVIAGSCSAATRRQVSVAQKSWPWRKLDLEALQRDPSETGAIVDWACAQNPLLPVVIFASSTPQEVESMQNKFGIDAAGAMVETALASIAHQLTGSGFSQLIIAGGETSGAVMSALGIEALEIGAQIDPGVPWTISLGEPGLNLALKSGNFGRDDFFSHAFEMLEKA